MKYTYSLLIILIILCTCSNEPRTISQKLPEFMIGTFEDDYGISYEITDSTFRMENQTLIHITQIDTQNQYFIGQNDSLNQYDPLLYSRIDWMPFDGMGAFKWGFCMTAFNASSPDSLSYESGANRDNPREGCNGFPFSRMKVLN